MQSVDLISEIINPVVIPFNKIVYPQDRYAIYKGVSFSDCSITLSPQFRSCAQIDRGVEIEDLHYYKWTLEKLNHFGKSFEHLLLSNGKGCGVSSAEISKLPYFESKTERFDAYASIATSKFISLYKSISDKWDPNRQYNRIIFFKLFFGKYTIYEGRHRLCILMHKLKDEEEVVFKTESGSIRSDYYFIKFKKYVKDLFHFS